MENLSEYSGREVKKMEKPKLSILILTHNRRELLEAAMDSINNGHYLDIEVVILNTGDAIIPNKYWKCDYYHEPELGLTESYARLIELSNGEYSIFLEDDDKIIINSCWESLMLYEADLHLFNYVVNDELSHKFYEVNLWGDSKYDSKRFLKEMHGMDKNGDFHLSQTVFKTEIAKKIVFPDSNVIGMDEYFLYKMCTLSEKVVTNFKPSYMARIHGNNLSWNNPKNIIENAKTPIHLVYKDVQDFLGEADALVWSRRISDIYEEKLTRARKELLTPRKINTTRV